MNSTNMNYPPAFFLDNLTDRQLTELIEDIQREQTNRTTRRARWIQETYALYLKHPNATYMRINNTIIVSVYSRTNGLRMCCSTPSHNDKFDRIAGVAVAFAKACGERIPSFV